MSWGQLARLKFCNIEPRRDGRFYQYTLTDGSVVTARSAAASQRNWAGLSEDCIRDRLRNRIRDPERLFAKNKRIRSKLKRQAA